MAQKANPATRHVVSINDLSDKDIETIFEIAQSFLKELPDPHFPYRIGRSSKIASNFILASLFFEPSTRTRLSFESAMLRLGGEVITSADPATSSAAKGESLADSVRVISNYADIMVIRHPRDGAARLAADYSPIPVINGGDGSHEHPTQTLCDLFTLKKKNKHLKNLKVAISGDLRGSRTIHSFVYALARFGATIMPMPAKGMELPEHVGRRLREEFGCQMVSVQKGEGDPSIDALYVTPKEPHQQSLFAGPEINLDSDVVEQEGRRRLCHALPEGAMGREGPALSEDRPEIPQRAEIFRGQRAAPAAARRRARRVGGCRPPRRLFRAGRLRRAGAHGADLAAARDQGQVAAQIRGRLRTQEISGL